MGKHLERQALERLGKDWSKAKSTREKLLQNTKEFVSFISVTYGLERIENLKPKMMEAYILDRQQVGIGASALAGKMTMLREIAAAIGKKNIVPRTNKEYGIERTRINPQPVNNEKLEAVQAVLLEQAKGGDRVAMMMVAADALRSAFGLRAKESLLSSKILEKEGKVFLAIEGAKGGRPRNLEIDNQAKRQAAELAQKTSNALGSGTGRIIPPEMSLQQAYDAQRNRWRELGGTRKNNANMHGERHLYARAMKAEGATKQEIMAELGHGEERSPAAYGV